MGRTICVLAAIALTGLSCTEPFGIPTTLVVINDAYPFLPDTITIDRGAYVEWKNEGTQYHLVQGDSTEPGGLQEIALAPVGGEDMTYMDSQGQLQFNQPGVFPYHCTVHTQMHGVLIVR